MRDRGDRVTIVCSACTHSFSFNTDAFYIYLGHLKTVIHDLNLQGI